MKNRIFLFIFFFGIHYFINAQSQNDILHRGSIYVEFFGNTYGPVSINYEKIFHSKRYSYLHFTSRVGVGFTTRVKDSIGAYNLPIETSILIGKHKNYIEFGLGWTPSIGKKSVLNYNGNSPVYFKTVENIFFIRLGYRRLTEDSTYRFAPLMQIENNPLWKRYFTIGIAVGYSW